MPERLPDDVDPAIAFFSERCQGDDYLYDSVWSTFPGRMAAYCPHDATVPDYRISAYELPGQLPDVTRAWVAGFLAGSLPLPPDEAVDEDGNAVPEVMERWQRLAEQFHRTGWWPPAEMIREYYAGESAFPEFKAEVP